jgi:hypothetical protein
MFLVTIAPRARIRGCWNDENGLGFVIPIIHPHPSWHRRQWYPHIILVPMVDEEAYGHARIKFTHHCLHFLQRRLQHDPRKSLPNIDCFRSSLLQHPPPRSTSLNFTRGPFILHQRCSMRFLAPSGYLYLETIV